jgi:hypothetical protein
MRLTAVHLRWAAILIAWGLLAFAAMLAADRLLGLTSPFTPAAVSAVFSAAAILLLRRYGPRGPVEPRRQRFWLLSGLGASGLLMIGGLIVAAWMQPPHAKPGAACFAQSWTDRISECAPQSPPNGSLTHRAG